MAGEQKRKRAGRINRALPQQVDQRLLRRQRLAQVVVLPDQPFGLGIVLLDVRQRIPHIIPVLTVFAIVIRIRLLYTVLVRCGLHDGFGRLLWGWLFAGIQRFRSI